MEEQQPTATLKRAVNFPLMVLYGLGTMVGGGIYALTGKVAGEAGMYAPVAFAISAFLALLTACSYSELVARFPYSSGEAHYIHNAFNRRWFTKTVGWAVVLMGLVSSSALSTAAAGLLADFTGWPEATWTALVVLTLAGFAIWGISESVWLVSTITLIEVLGLVFVIVTSGEAFQTFPARAGEMFPATLDIGVWVGIASASFLAFYAFIGFEDMVNIAEEVKNVRRTMPMAILTCITITLVLYMLVSLAGVLSVPVEALAKSKAPMVEILKHNGGEASLPWMKFVSLMAVVNGALVQIIMASRVIYGMAESENAPAVFKDIHPVTRTPVKATLVIVSLIMLLALLMNLSMLAKITSSIVILVFACMNAAVLKIKSCEDEELSEDIPTYPNWIAWVALITCVAMLCVGVLKNFIG